MRTSSVSRRISLTLAVMLCWMLICVTCFFVFSRQTMQAVLDGQTSHAEAFVPAKRQAAAFEREILNARIFFIYFVTIQKPGSLEKGWERYHNAQAALQELTTQVGQHEELSVLRAPVAKLQADIDSYGVILADTLKMVQNGERAGSPNYDAHVKAWAASGLVMVTDAGNVETLCASTSEASTNSIVKLLKNAEALELGLLCVSFLVSVILAWFLARRIDRTLEGETQADRSAMKAVEAL